MKYLSLFTGIGGFEYGIQNAYRSKVGGEQEDTEGNERQGFLPETGKDSSSEKGRTSTSTSDLPDERPLCVGYSEVDKYAIQIYQRHFPNHKNYGDITKIDADALPDFDLLCGGFPCQAFSIAGKRKGFEDTRGTLFFDIARILRAKRPRLLVLENVKGLLSHDNGETFRTIISALDELGYDLQWQVLNSKNFGVPQNRERVLIVGHLRGTPRPKVFPITNTNGEDSRQVTSTAIDANYWKGPDNHGQRTVIVHNIYGGFNEEKARVFETVSPTIRTSRGGGHLPSVLKGSTIRRLTPTECERLQGFPDGWTEWGDIRHEPGKGNDFTQVTVQEIPISDTQRYKMLGNAVTTNVIQVVVERLITH